MARQKPTNPDTPDWTLTPQQETAVVLLAGGKTVTDTATAIEVTRQTVSEWLNHHPGFQAALNRRRQELWISMTDTLRGLLPKALEVSPSKVLLFFGNFVPLARRRDPMKEGQGCRWRWGKSSNRL
jgi:hypothetical protein